LAQRGFHITALEAGPKLAAAARHNLADFRAPFSQSITPVSRSRLPQGVPGMEVPVDKGARTADLWP